MSETLHHWTELLTAFLWSTLCETLLNLLARLYSWYNTIYIFRVFVTLSMLIIYIRLTFSARSAKHAIREQILRNMQEIVDEKSQCSSKSSDLSAMCRELPHNLTEMIITFAVEHKILVARSLIKSLVTSLFTHCFRLPRFDFTFKFSQHSYETLTQTSTLIALWMLPHPIKPPHVSWSLFLQEICPIWSSIPSLVLILSFGRLDRTRNFDRSWWAFCAPAVIGYIAFLGFVYLCLKGLQAALSDMVRGLIWFESRTFLLACTVDGSLNLVGAGTPLRLRNLRYNPPFAVMMLVQILVWYFFPNHLWLSMALALCLYLRSGQHPRALGSPLKLSEVSQGANFCKTCKDSMLLYPEDDLEFRKNSRRTHHRFNITLRNAASQGCSICTSVWHKATSTPQDIWGFIYFWLPATSIHTEFATIRVCLNGNRDRSRSNYVDFSISIMKSKFRNSSSDVRSYRHYAEGRGPLFEDLPLVEMDSFSTHTGSIQSMRKARKWLDDCLVQHDCSSCEFKSSKLPSRLLYLGPAPLDAYKLESMQSLEFYPMKLVRLDDLASDTKYMTLSHCWGGSDRLRLTTANINAFCQAINFEALPKTYKDAIRVAKMLGAEYLWIDSLCIVQDSDADWYNEARKMGDIYQNSMCNIAASDSKNGNEGCLFERNPRLLEPGSIKLSMPDLQPLTPTGDVQSREVLLICETDPFEHMHVLYTRAWVFQEAFLAPRTLELARGQLFWRCSKGFASEIFPSGFPEPLSGIQTAHYHPVRQLPLFQEGRKSNVGGGLGYFKDVLSHSSHNTSNGDQMLLPSLKPNAYMNISMVWSDIVRSYTSMHFTRANDRLIALNGVILHLAPIIGASHYGIFEAFLPNDLLWHVQSAQARRTDPQRAPTWSWQSLDCPIRNNHALPCFGSNQVSVSEWREIFTLPSVISGQHHKRALRLYGPLLRVTWESSPGPYIHKHSTVGIRSVEGKVNRFKLGDISLPFATDSPGNIFFDETGTAATGYGRKEVCDAFCLPIAFEWCDGYGPSQYKGLVIIRMESGYFKRIGYFEAFGDCFRPIIAKTASQQIVLV